MNKFIEKQESLQDEATEVLDELNLLDFLSKFGSAKIIGSMALGLMTWKDVDIDVAVDELKEGDYFQTVWYLFGNPEVKRLVLSDNRILGEKLKLQGIPESIYLGVFVEDKEGGEWKIDIRFVVSSSVRAEKYIDEIKGKLNDENREIILEIKSVICSHPKYLTKEISSVDVYNTVLEKNIRDINSFKNYFSEKGIEL